jgi:hypothetical protein
MDMQKTWLETIVSLARARPRYGASQLTRFFQISRV